MYQAQQRIRYQNTGSGLASDPCRSQPGFSKWSKSITTSAVWAKYPLHSVIFLFWAKNSPYCIGPSIAALCLCKSAPKRRQKDSSAMFPISVHLTKKYFYRKPDAWVAFTAVKIAVRLSSHMAEADIFRRQITANLKCLKLIHSLSWAGWPYSAILLNDLWRAIL